MSDSFNELGNSLCKTCSLLLSSRMNMIDWAWQQQALTYDWKKLALGMKNTGCLAVTVTTLILNNIFISGPIIKPFNSMKVETIRICLVYKTPYKVPPATV